MKSSYYELIAAHSATPAQRPRRMKTANATRQRLAHLNSARLILSMIICFSASVLSGSQSPSTGTRRGEKRIITPMIQNGGNTAMMNVRDHVDVNGRRKRRTESEFEEIHGERCRLVLE